MIRSGLEICTHFLCCCGWVRILLIIFQKTFLEFTGISCIIIELFKRAPDFGKHSQCCCGLMHILLLIFLELFIEFKDLSNTIGEPSQKDSARRKHFQFCCVLMRSR
jgi:hypothetical protein